MKEEGYVVLALFDGMCCGMLGLLKAGVKVKTYYASEIDKHAIKVTMANFPNVKQIGDVRNVNSKDLENIDIVIGGSPCQSFSFAGKRKGMSTKCNTDILTLEHYLQLKSEGFEFEGQSYLFWEYMRLLKEVKPKYFFLENVVMGEKWERILSNAIGVNPILINSALVSAQNRRRLYWTNIGMQPMGLFGYLESIIPQPTDKGILLKDILETNVDDKYFLSNKMLKYFKNRAANLNQGKVNIREEEGKASCLTSSMASCDISDNFIAIDCDGNHFSDKSGALLSRYHKGPSTFGTNTFIKVDTDLKISKTQNKASCFTAGGNSAGLHSDMTLIVASRGRNLENPKSRKVGLNTEQHLEPRFDGKTNCLTSVQKDNLVMQLNTVTESNGRQPYQQNRVYDINGISPALLAQMSCGTHAILVPEATKKGFAEILPGECFDFENPTSETRRGRKMEDKSNCLMAQTTTNFMQYTNDFKIRRLTPTECERLQTVPDGYTNHVSDTQRYRMLGNGWTIDAVAHIFKYLLEP